jgi:hypothetical protein
MPDAVLSSSAGKTSQRFSWLSEEAPKALKSGQLKLQRYVITLGRQRCFNALGELPAFLL